MYTTWFKGQWSDGNTPLMGAMDHGVWLGSSVFDGARSIHRMAVAVSPSSIREPAPSCSARTSSGDHSR